MSEDRMVILVQEHCPDLELAPVAGLMREWTLDLSPDAVRRVAEVLVQGLGIYHLSTITGQDRDGQIELLYHFWQGRGLTLRTRLPYENAHIQTLTDLIPGVAFYEREIWEMLHVAFDGHHGLQRLLLPDDWSGEAPLRSDPVSQGASG